MTRGIKKKSVYVVSPLCNFSVCSVSKGDSCLINVNIVWVCVWVCMGVCVWRGKEGVCVCVCVCGCVFFLSFI